MQSEDWGEVLLPEQLSRGTRLYVGSLVAAENAAFHVEARIKHVLTAAGRLRPDLPEPRPSHLSLKLADHPTANLLAELNEALAFCDLAFSPEEDDRTSRILNKGHDLDADIPRGLLVHCASGVSRSVSICVAYLMTRGGVSYEDALAAVKMNREQACPNLGFERQLKILEQCGGDVARAMDRWSEDAGKDAMEQAISQRQAANSLHEKLDALEDEIACARSAASTTGGLSEEQRQGFVCTLDKLQEDIDSCLGECHDRPATSILKAAARKVARLVDGI